MANAVPMAQQMANAVPMAQPMLPSSIPIANAAPLAPVRRGPRVAPRPQVQVMPQVMPQAMPQEIPFVDDHKYDT